MGAHRAEVPDSMQLSAVITRADGTIEDLGVISARYANPVRQWWWEQYGRRVAERRIRRANQRQERTNPKG